MKSAFVLALLSAVLFLASANRAKRFIGGLSTVGGHVGCVISENKLFINGRYTAELNDNEVEELEQYKKQQDLFRDNVKKYIEANQKQVGDGEAKALKKPEPPKKPSFCSDKATTQYVFDGCSVQGDGVYIGNNFVRKLTVGEKEELEQFDKQFTAYQKAVTGQFRKQVEEIFGRHFGGLFEGGSSKSTEVVAQPEGVEKGPAPEAPKTPQFCTLIV